MIRPTQHRRRKRRNELAERSYQRAIMSGLAKELDQFIGRPCTQETYDEMYEIYLQWFVRNSIQNG